MFFYRDCLDESASILDDLSIPDDTEMPGYKLYFRYSETRKNVA